MIRTVDNSELMLVTDDTLMTMSNMPEFTIVQIEPNGNYQYIVEVIRNETTK